MTITGRVKNGCLFFDSASAWLKYLSAFDGKEVEVEVREKSKDENPLLQTPTPGAIQRDF